MCVYCAGPGPKLSLLKEELHKALAALHPRIAEVKKEELIPDTAYRLVPRSQARTRRKRKRK